MRIEQKIFILFIIFIFSGSLTNALKMQIDLDESVQFLNKEIISFARKSKGKKVGRGECWDLAAIPLKKYNAAWDGRFVFGKKIAEGNKKGHIKISKIRPARFLHKYYDMKISYISVKYSLTPISFNANAKFLISFVGLYQSNCLKNQ